MPRSALEMQQQVTYQSAYIKITYVMISFAKWSHEISREIGMPSTKPLYLYGHVVMQLNDYAVSLIFFAFYIDISNWRKVEFSEEYWSKTNRKLSKTVVDSDLKFQLFESSELFVIIIIIIIVSEVITACDVIAGWLLSLLLSLSLLLLYIIKANSNH